MTIVVKVKLVMVQLQYLLNAFMIFTCFNGRVVYDAMFLITLSYYS